VLGEATARPVGAESRERIIELCAALWKPVRLQTGAAKYNASGAERSRE
jgi:hypothetical protein